MAEWESQRIDRSSISDLVQVIDSFATMGERERTNIHSSLDSLKGIIASAQTDEQFNNAALSLSQTTGRSSSFADTELTHNALSSILENKRQDYDQFTSAMDEASDMINSKGSYEGLDFIDTAAEWENLESLRLKKTNLDGTPKHESVADMLSDDYAKLTLLAGRMSKGAEGGYRYNKNEYLKDDEILQKMLVYQNRMDKAIQASLHNGVITQEEAALIMQPIDLQAYNTEMNRIVSENKTFITDTRSRITTIDKLINQGVVHAETINYFTNYDNDGDGEPDFQDVTIKDDDGNDINILAALAGGDIGVLEKLKTSEQAELDVYYSKHLFLTGTSYGMKDVVVKMPDDLDDEEAKLWAEIEKDMDKEEKSITDKDLMERYGTTNIEAIKEKLKPEVKVSPVEPEFGSPRYKEQQSVKLKQEKEQQGVKLRQDKISSLMPDISLKGQDNSGIFSELGITAATSGSSERLDKDVNTIIKSVGGTGKVGDIKDIEKLAKEYGLSDGLFGLQKLIDKYKTGEFTFKTKNQIAAKIVSRYNIILGKIKKKSKYKK